MSTAKKIKFSFLHFVAVVTLFMAVVLSFASCTDDLHPSNKSGLIYIK